MIKVESICGQGKRESNLDFFYQLSEHIFLILDGYGSTTKEDISGFYREVSSKNCNKLEDLIHVIQLISPNFQSCITIIEIKGCYIRYFYQGDIRIYVNSILITKDHSYAWMLLERKNCFSAEKIASKCLFHKYRNLLYKNIKNIDDTEKQIEVLKVDLPSKVLVCTDGYWTIEHEKIIKSGSYSLNELVSKDNYSAILFSIT